MIYHIAKKSEWTLAKTEGHYTPESLHTEGFIHCSTSQQVMRVANFYYKGVKGLILLEINEDKLKVELKWEGEGVEKFPHIYGPLEVYCVEREADLIENSEGVFDFPLQTILH